MQKISLLFSLLGTFALVAEEVERISPQLKGVLLVDNSSKVRESDLEQISGIQFDGLESAKGKLTTELTPFIADLSCTADGMQQLCNAITNHYREDENLRVFVTIPEQDTSDGVVQLVVAPERLGTINVKDNQHTDAESLKKWVRLSPNDPINEKVLAQDVGWMNSNAFRKVNVAYQPAKEPGVTDVDLMVSDKKNWKIYSGVDNTGTDPIGPLHIFGKVSINNFIFTNHVLDIQATTADHYSEYQAYKLTYIAPLPWRNTIKITGAYKGTTPHRSPYPQQHRDSFQASGRYIVPQWFGPNAFVDQISYEGGVDFKGSNTNLFAENNPKPIDKQLAFIGQFAGRVSAMRAREGSKIMAGIDLVGSPSRMLPHQTDADFNNMRPGSTPSYFYSRLSMSFDQQLSSMWKIFLQGKTQLSLSTLIPSEQLSLGGASTIRGYAESAVSGDQGVYGNLELKTVEFPAVGIWLPQVKDSLSFLGFVDAGYAWLKSAMPGQPLQQSLIGVGPGVRYEVASYFSGRLDVGFPLLDVEDSSSSPHVHFNAILSY